jgi:chaperonin GroES
VLFRKDEAKAETKGGIVLPDSSKQERITGRIVEISPDIEHDDNLPLNIYDKVLVDPRGAIPVDFDADNMLFIIPVKDVLAVFRKTNAPTSGEV